MVQDMRDVIKREWMAGTPDERICKIAEIKPGDLYRIVSSLELPQHRRVITTSRKHTKTRDAAASTPSAIMHVATVPLAPKDREKYSTAQLWSIREQAKQPLLELSQIERMKDAVGCLKGKLTITAYPPRRSDYFRVEWDDKGGRPLYRRYVLAEGATEEVLQEVSLSEVHIVFNTRDVAVRVEYKSSEPRWFDTRRDRRAMEKLFFYIMKLG
jgi:hypothetical protein